MLVRILINKKVIVTRVESRVWGSNLVDSISITLHTLVTPGGYSELYCCEPVSWSTGHCALRLKSPRDCWESFLTYPFGIQIPCKNPSFRPLVLRVTTVLASEDHCSFCSWGYCLGRPGRRWLFKSGCWCGSKANSRKCIWQFMDVLTVDVGYL